MDTLDEALTALMEEWKKADDTAKAAIVKKVHKGAQPIYQAIFGKGLNKAKKDAEEADADEENQESKASLKKQLQEAKDALEASKTEEGKGKGDAKLVARISELETQLAAEKKGRKDEVAAERTKRVQANKERGDADILALLTGDGKLKPRAARYLMVDPEFRKRLKVDAEGAYTLLDADGNPIAGDTTAQRKAFAEAAREMVEADDILPNTPSAGGGSQSEGGGSSGGSYDPVAAGKARAKEQKAAAANDTAFR
jgi:hypothetical protein